MGDESIVGIVDLMTGEKDPRNLMLVFSILKVVMVEWDITNHAEVCLALTTDSGTEWVKLMDSSSLIPCTITSPSHSDLPRMIRTASRHKT